MKARTRKKGDFNNYYGNSDTPTIKYSNCHWSELPPEITCLELLYLLRLDREQVVIAHEAYLWYKTKKIEKYNKDKTKKTEDIEKSYTKLIKAKMKRMNRENKI